MLPRHVGAKRDGVISASASERAGWIIISITVRSRTSHLKHLRINRRLTSSRCIIRAATTVLWTPERFTRTLTRVALTHSQLSRALPVQIRDAPGRSAHTRPAAPFDYHGHVVPVHQADVIEVLTAGPKCELS